MTRLLSDTALRALAAIAPLLVAGACSSTVGGVDPGPASGLSVPEAAGSGSHLEVGDSRAPALDEARDERAPGRALLVGIGEFMSEDVTPLRGPVNDVPMMHTLLRDRFGFDPSKMTMLLNQQATRERVIEELDAHIAALGEDELFVFYLSGHGSQSPDRGTDEEDGMDETFVMYDSRTPSGYDLSDDDLNYSFGKLEKTQAVVILDTCHSGSGTRGVLLKRAVDPDLRVRGSGNAGGRGELATTEIDETHVLLTAAAANQVAVETKIGDENHGVFTKALVLALSNSDPAKPLYDFVLEDLQREVTKLRDKLNIKGLANPQLEAPSAVYDRPLFNLQRKHARVAWSAVEPAAGNRVRVVDGARGGTQIGSVWGLYGAEELEFAPASALARARCVGITPDGNDALLELDGDAPDHGSGARAVLVAEAPAGPIGLQLGGDDVREVLAEELTAALGAAGRLTKELEPGGWKVLAGASGGFDLLLADESPWASVERATAVEDLAALTKHCAVVDAFESLDHASSGLNLAIDLASSLEPRGAGSRGAAIAPEAGLPTYDLADIAGSRSLKNSLLLDLHVDRPGLLTLVFVDDKGSSVTFFPSASQAEDFLPNGQLTRGWVRIPDKFRRPSAGLHLDVGPPPGIQAIAALVIDDADATKVVRERLAASASDPDALIAELGRLREDLHYGSLAHVDWDAATVTYVVVGEE